MIIDELVVKLGIKGGKESVAAMQQLKTTTLAAKAAAIGAVIAFAKMSQEARKVAMDMSVFETATGLSGEVLEKMSFRAAAAGVSLDNYGDTLQRIQQMTKDIAYGQGDIAPFQMWGIGVNNNPIKVMDQIQARLKQLHQRSPADAAKLARDFGLSNEMMYALLQGQTEEIEEQWLLKAKDREALVSLNKEWYKLWWYVKQIGIRSQGILAHVALPIVKACVKIVKSVGEIFYGLSDIASKIRDIKAFLMIIGALIVAALAWTYPIIAAIVAIALALEDVYGYFTGKDSITGRMIEWIKSGEILKDIFMTIAEIMRTISKSIFGAKITKKIFDFFGGKDESGAQKDVNLLDPSKSKKPWYIGRPSILPDFNFAKPALATGMGGFTLTQNNVANFLARGAEEDGRAAGEFVNEAAVSNAQMQEADISREE